MQLPELNAGPVEPDARFSLVYMAAIVFSMNAGFILLVRRSRLQTMTMLCGTAVIPAVVFFGVKTIAGFVGGDLDIVTFEYGALTRTGKEAHKIPLFTCNVGLIAGVAALTFCFQEEAVSMLHSSDQDREKTRGKLNKGFLMTGLFMIGAVVFGGIAFATDSSHPEGRTPLSLSDYYIGKLSLERVLMAVVSFAQILPMVPLYSLKAASFVACAHQLAKIADDDRQEPLWSRLKLKGLAIVLSACMAWSFFAPRGAVYCVVAVAGGVLGFCFIFAVPLLAHWKANDNTVLLEQRLNLAAQKARKARGLRRSEYSNRESQASEDERSTAAHKVWLFFFLVAGISCLVLPVAACFGILSQP